MQIFFQNFLKLKNMIFDFFENKELHIARPPFVHSPSFSPKGHLLLLATIQDFAYSINQMLKAIQQGLELQKKHSTNEETTCNVEHQQTYIRVIRRDTYRKLKVCANHFLFH
jgi:hypothetical protein